jgi:hypothetical protein
MSGPGTIVELAQSAKNGHALVPEKWHALVA